MEREMTHWGLQGMTKEEWLAQSPEKIWDQVKQNIEKHGYFSLRQAYRCYKESGGQVNPNASWKWEEK